MFLKKLCFVILLCIQFFCLMAQQKPNNYTAAWKRIDSLIQKQGLTQSALTEVNKIYNLAKREKNDVQVIKALLYRMQLQSLREENAFATNLADLEKELIASTGPEQSIIASITAESYWRYFQNYRWQLYDRTRTVNFEKGDVATWGVDDFHKKISRLYLLSLENEKLLQQTKLDPFDAIIIKGNARNLRPTLFDLLAHRALDYFRNDERDVARPSFAFEINDPNAFADANIFTTHSFATNDSTSLHFKALQLYQRVLRFHLKDVLPDALIDADIHRLTFVKLYGVMADKENLYRRALEKLTAKYPTLPSAAQAFYLLAEIHASRARQYDALHDTTFRYEWLEAKKIIENVITFPASSEGKVNSRNLLNEINQKEIHFQTELVNIPDQPFRVLLQFRNLTNVHFRVVRLDKNIKDALGNNHWEEDYWKNLLQRPAVKSLSQPLPDTKDHQKHAAEIKVDGLPIGEYALVASVSKDFKVDNNQLAVQYFHVSNISFINNGYDYFALHRETGQPLSQAIVQVWQRNYDATNRRYADIKGPSLTADKNGYFRVNIPSVNQRRSNNTFRLELGFNKDRLMLDEYTYYFFPGTTEQQIKDFKTSFLFTDRSLYRPGQTVHFKGIMVSRNEKGSTSQILPNLRTTIFLHDVNDQRIDSLTVTTNEFGSYSGKFTLPSNVLNGAFILKDNTTNSMTSFAVEEYKRPKFIVDLPKPTGTYRVNDTITITGTAKAYAGNSINDASVSYRVVRKVMMPFWKFGFGSRIWPPRPQDQMEIANGRTQSDANGEFKITFKAIPDNTIPKKDQPVFYYEVTADVTDISGETRSSTSTVSVAYQALQLSIALPEKLHTDSVADIRLSSTNLNNVFEKTLVTVSLYSLKMPDKIYRPRYWQRPDQFVMSKEEFAKWFPHDLYSDEDDVSKWPRIKKVVEKTDTTKANASFHIHSNVAGNFKSSLPAGWYVIEAVSKDKYGEEVKAINYIQLFNDTVVSPASSVHVTVDKPSVQPGEKITYHITSNVDSLFIIHDIVRDTVAQRSFISAKNLNHRHTVSIDDKDFGGIQLYAAFVKHNRVYVDHVAVDIPRLDKQLQISFETFRDKTLPGSEETWKVKIIGNKSDKVAAELLTTMYDASLDQFTPYGWQAPSLWTKSLAAAAWTGSQNFIAGNSREKYTGSDDYVSFEKRYDDLATDRVAVQESKISAVPVSQTAPMAREGMVDAKEESQASNRSLKANNAADTAAPPPAAQPPTTAGSQMQLRKNFNETAFFFPDLKTDASGNIVFSFTMPEALTQWKWMLLAHTKDLAFGFNQKIIVTQKELMVQPNPPRFMREGDRMDFGAKIVNLSSKELTGQVELQLIDPSTNQPVDGWFRNLFPNQYFTAAAGQSVPVNFTIEIPFQYNRPVTYRLIAGAGDLKDGEEMMLPVISNKMLVTESVPLPMRGNAKKQFKFEKLLQSGNSETLTHHAVTVEFTSNPAWYAIQALPYLMEYPYECSEQNFNKFYANALATKIASSSPRIREVFDKWRITDSAALMSNLEKNQELKSVLLQETPWIMQAQNEQHQKRNIALLFDMVRMSRELGTTLNKLKEMQTSNGGFVWFKGGPDDRYITQYILTGIGHLQKLNAIPSEYQQQISTITRTALRYLDLRMKEDYDNLVKRKIKLENNNLGYLTIQYLYMRTFFSATAVGGEYLRSYTYFRKQSQQFWLQQSRYMQGMIALSLHRTGDVQTAKNITASLKQNAIVSEELGMYWKDIPSGYFWYQAPVETQSLLIETFSEISNDKKVLDDLKTWLLKQKQTRDWRTTKATADACYALLLEGSDWLSKTPDIRIVLGDQSISELNQASEAGTGYFKKAFEGKSVKPSMGDIQVFVSNGSNNSMPAWGAVYWQYFEDLNKITAASTPLKLVKKLFVEKNSDRGPVLEPVNEGELLKVGDKIKVRIELRSDRDMEYVHMKDMRGACMEPVNVISQYKWQGGLGYYETTKDASTNFFFNWLPKGTYVFEYPMFVTHSGTFSNGITSIQCMYAPEFNSHSEGVKVNVEQRTP